MLTHAYKSFGAPPAHVTVLASDEDYAEIRKRVFENFEELHASWQVCPAGNPLLELPPLPEDLIPFRKFALQLAGQQVPPE